MRVFDEVRTNPAATIPCALIAAGAMLIAGIGGWLWWVIKDFPESGQILLHSTILGSAIALALWGIAWLGLVYVMLTQVFRTRAYVEQLLRVMGLAMAPISLMGLMFIPGISLAVGIAALAFTFAMMCVAVSTATTAEPGQVLMANLVGFVVWASVLTLLATSGGSELQPHAPGVFLFNVFSDAAGDALTAANSLPQTVPSNVPTAPVVPGR
ncbi:MAG TPA: hypothetical protein VH951_13965 [Dehalococcoidia bacterium]